MTHFESTGTLYSVKTIADAQIWATQLLTKAGVERAARESEILLADCMRADRIYLMARPERVMDRESWEQFQGWVERRAQREPLAYITGKRWFYGLELTVAPGALIPRPETELLVECFLNWQSTKPFPLVHNGNLTEGVHQETPCLLDAGTGSGCIAIACLLNAPRWQGIGIDSSSDALEIARLNRERYGLSKRLELQCASWLETIEPHSIDALLSNPPYVRYEEWETLEPEVRDWEPLDALVADRQDPLRAYRELIEGAKHALKPEGLIAFEVGVSTAQEVAQIMAARGFTLQVEHDLQGLPRVIWSIAI